MYWRMISRADVLRAEGAVELLMVWLTQVAAMLVQWKIS